jgi:hypothetical protein
MGTIQIGAATDEINDGVGATTSPGMRPGVAPGGGDSTALRAQFLALGNVAVWRHSFDEFNITGGARSWAQLQSQIEEDIASPTGVVLGQALAAGVPCLISNCVTPPAWMRTATGDAKTGPMSLANMYQYGYFTAKAAIAAAIANGYDPLLLLWDFENESEDTQFSSVNFTMMLRLWSAYRKGVKDAGAELGVNPPVGGMQFHDAPRANVIAATLGPDRYPETGLLEFIRYTAHPPEDDIYAISAMPDFYSCHFYATGDAADGAPALTIRRYLRSVGVPDTAPIYIGETCFHGSFAITNVQRDREEGAASVVVNHKALADAGVHGVCHLQIGPNTGGITFPAGYDGEFGLVKFAGAVPISNGCYTGYRMMARLGARRITASLTQSDENRGIHAIASASGGNRFILIARYQLEDASNADRCRRAFFTSYMVSRLGYDLGGQLDRELDFSAGLTRAEIVAYCNGGSSGQIASGALPSYFTGRPGALPGRTLAEDCAEAKAAAVELGANLASTTSVSVEITDAASVTAWRRYRISSAAITNNPHRAYIGQSGANEAAAIAAAQAQETLTAEATGANGSAFPMALTLSPYELILLEIDAPDPQSVAGTLVPWVSVGSTTAITTYLRYRSAQDDYTLQVANTSAAVVEALVVLPLVAYTHGRIQRIDEDATIRGTWEPYVRSHVLPATFNMSRLKIMLRAKQRQTYRFTR